MAKLSEATKPYQPFGAARELLYAKGDEVCLVGPSGTGKSRSCLEKLFLCMDKYAGARSLIVRKTRKALTNAALVTFEDKVVPKGHPILTPVTRPQRHAYSFPNESEIEIGGMDNPDKIMSTEYDMIYVQEVPELSIEAYENLTTRLRNGVMPYQQIISDANPSYPWHWLKKRHQNGHTQFLESKHEDNPRLWDMELGQWTEEGAKYIARLDRLTGARLLRLRYGKWAAAEGMIFDAWEPGVHVITRNTLPKGWKDWPTLWVIDFGFVHPFVWQEWLIGPDGRLYRNKEIYMTKRLVEDHCSKIHQVTKDRPEPTAVICDHDAEDRATIERKLGVRTIAAFKKVKAGIQAVQERLRIAADGKPRIYYLADALVEVDEELQNDFKPTCTEQEYDSYVWDNDAPSQQKNEFPVKEDDHGMDTTRYVVAHLDLKGRKKLRIFQW